MAIVSLPTSYKMCEIVRYPSSASQVSLSRAIAEKLAASAALAHRRRAAADEDGDVSRRDESSAVAAGSLHCSTVCRDPPKLSNFIRSSASEEVPIENMFKFSEASCRWSLFSAFVPISLDS